MDKVSQKVLKAMGIFGSVQTIGIACSVVRAKLIAIWIGPAGVGLFGIFNSVIEMIVNATQFNMRQSAVRDIADSSAAELPHTAASVRWWARTLGVLGAAVSLCASPLLSLISFDTIDWWWAFASLSIVFLCLAITMGEQTLMQGTGQLRLLAKSVMWGTLSGTILSVPMYYYWGEGSIIPSLIVFAIAGTIAALASRSVASAQAHWRRNMERGFSFLKLGAYLTVSSFTAAAASYAFKSYITNADSISATGLYQAGYTLIVNYVGIVFSAIGMEFYPRLVGVATRIRMASTVINHEIALISSVLAPFLIVFIMADELIVQLLYSEEFSPILPMIVWGVGGAMFRAASYCISFLIVARGDGRMFVIVDVASALIGLCLNVAFYNLWGMAGLGLSYTAWYFIYMLMVGIACRTRYGLRINRQVAVKTIALMACVAAAAVLRQWSWLAPAIALAPATAVITYYVRRASN